MKLLAFDSSTFACSIALQINDSIDSFHVVAPMQQTKLLLPQINEMLNRAQHRIQDLDAIILGAGPGSFTGIRLAASVAQGLAFAANIPVIPVSSLAATAQAAYLQHGWQDLLVAQDARMNAVYWGAYRINVAGLASLIGKERATTPEEVHMPEPGNWHGLGDAWEKNSAKMGFTPVMIDSEQLPTAVALLQLGKFKYDQHDWVNAKDALPVYLR
jgi:tRNA threonylcarbamoyladenosine biosynthesis protein TsaB